MTDLTNKYSTILEHIPDNRKDLLYIINIGIEHIKNKYKSININQKVSAILLLKLWFNNHECEKDNMIIEIIDDYFKYYVLNYKQNNSSDNNTIINDNINFVYLYINQKTHSTN